MRNGPVLTLAGDVMLGRLANAAARSRGAAHPWGNLLPLLRRSDAFLVNLECALTRRSTFGSEARAKAFHFRGDPERVESLRIARVTAASLANNHVCDFGDDGLLDTIRTLDEAGILHAGAGATRDDARRPALLRVCGRSVALLAAADYPPEWAATALRPGIHFVPVSTEPKAFAPVEAAVRAARAAADWVVFSIHWGPNMRDRPTSAFRDFAHRVVEAGATVFWGHSAHVVQGVEFHGRHLILYDTGDLVDDYAVDPDLRNDLTGLFRVRLGPSGVERLEIVPARIAHCRVDRATGEDHDRFARRLAERSAEWGTRVERAGEGDVLVASPERLPTDRPGAPPSGRISTGARHPALRTTEERSPS